MNPHPAGFYKAQPLSAGCYVQLWRTKCPIHSDCAETSKPEVETKQSAIKTQDKMG